MIRIHRLRSDDRASWALFPVFEQRVLRFFDQYSRDFTPQQRERFRPELRQRWVNTPLLAGYWLLLHDDGPFSKDVGHLCAWVQECYGRPYVMLFQTECEPSHETREVLMLVIAEAEGWFAQINRELVASAQRQGVPPQLLDYFELWTEKSFEAWKRLMPNLKWRRAFNVLRVSLGQPQQTVAAQQNGHLPVNQRN